MAAPTTNIQASGTDLNALFAEIGSTTKASDVGYKLNGVDISNYFHASQGAFDRRASVSISANGTDLSSIFRDINFVPISVSVNKTAISGSCSGVFSCFAVSDNVTVSIVSHGTNGSGNYSYLWQFEPGVGSWTPSIVGETSAVAGISDSIECGSGGVFGHLTCRVTDNVTGQVVYSPSVSASLGNDWSGTCG